MKRSKILFTIAAVSGLLLPRLVSAAPIRHIERAYYSDARPRTEAPAQSSHLDLMGL